MRYKALEKKLYIKNYIRKLNKHKKKKHKKNI